MDTINWRQIFAELQDIEHNIELISHLVQNEKSIQQLKDAKQKLVTEAERFFEIHSFCHTTAANILQAEDIDKWNLATKILSDIDNRVSKLYEFIQHYTIQRNIDAAILASINIFRKQIQPAYDEINKTHDKFEVIFLNSNNLKLIKQFDSIDIRTIDKINTACKEVQTQIGEKFFIAKNKNQIRKIFREVKKFINEEINYAVKLHHYALSKFRILLKTVKIPNNPKKFVILKKKNRSENEYLSEIKKHAHVFVIMRNEFSSNFNWKYRKKETI